MKPILFNTKMVKEILDGRKSVTRRINKDGSEFSVPDMSFFDEERRTYAVRNYADKALLEMSSLVEAPVPICPGDILYVRETYGDYSECTPGGVGYYMYRADYPDGAKTTVHPDGTAFDLPRWRPSIHMPKEAARIFLRVTDVRVERLQEISAEGCRKEGMKSPCFGCKATFGCDNCFNDGYTEIGEYAELWDSTVKPADRERYGWAANPWVWVIEFERCEKPKEEEA